MKYFPPWNTCSDIQWGSSKTQLYRLIIEYFSHFQESKSLKYEAQKTGVWGIRKAKYSLFMASSTEEINIYLYASAETLSMVVLINQRHPLPSNKKKKTNITTCRLLVLKRNVRWKYVIFLSILNFQMLSYLLVSNFQINLVFGPTLTRYSSQHHDMEVRNAGKEIFTTCYRTQQKYLL